MPECARELATIEPIAPSPTNAILLDLMFIILVSICLKIIGFWALDAATKISEKYTDCT